MPSNRLTFLALALACIGAAGVGGYLATRQSNVPAAAAPAPAAATSAPLPAQPANVEASVPPATVVAPVEPSAKPAAPAKSASRPAKVVSAPPPPAAAPASQTAAVPQAPVAPPPDLPTVPRPDDRAAVQEPPRPAEPPQKTFEELVVSANSVIGLQTETRLSSETARVEDRVEARVARDVRVGSTVAIPAGSRAIGSVTQVERGGKFKEKARLAIRFNTLVLPDGTRLPMSTETIFREGQAPGNAAAAKVGGGAAVGAILGGILGGGKGAAIGAAVGGGGGAAVVEHGDPNAATLPAGTSVTVRLLSPVTVTVEQR